MEIILKKKMKIWGIKETEDGYTIIPGKVVGFIRRMSNSYLENYLAETMNMFELVPIMDRPVNSDVVISTTDKTYDLPRLEIVQHYESTKKLANKRVQQMTKYQKKPLSAHPSRPFNSSRNVKVPPESSYYIRVTAKRPITVKSITSNGNIVISKNTIFTVYLDRSFDENNFIGVINSNHNGRVFIISKDFISPNQDYYDTVIEAVGCNVIAESKVTEEQKPILSSEPNLDRYRANTDMIISKFGDRTLLTKGTIFIPQAHIINNQLVDVFCDGDFVGTLYKWSFVNHSTKITE